MADFLKDIIIDGQLQTNERIYTLGGIRITGGIYDQNNSIGTAGQLLTSDGTNVEWVNTSQILGTQSNVTYYDVKNTTGATISKGKVVMAVGTDGNSGHILIDEMVADGSVEPRYILGVLNEDIAHGTTGQAIYLGQIKQLNTTGQNGETWSDGTVLWCDPNSPGDLTQTEPNGPNLKIPVAIVLNAATNGKIQVRATYNEGIHDLHDTKITTQADGELLVWNNTLGVWQNDGTATVDYTNGRVGIGTASPTSPLTIKSDSVSAQDSGITIQANGSTNDIIRMGEKSTNGGRLHMLDGGVEKIAFYTDGTDNHISAGNVGIGTTTVNAKLHVYSSTADLVSRFESSDALSYIQINDNSDSVYVGTQSGIGFVGGFASLNSSNLNINLTTGNVGIGTTNPVKPLHIYSSNDAPLRVESSDATTGILFADSTSNNALYYVGSGDYFYTTAKLGIGTNSPTGKLTVVGSGGQTNIESTGYILDLYRDNGMSSIYNSDNYGTLSLGAGGVENYLYVNWNGNVGIGTTSPSAKLDVAGNVSISNTATARLDISGGGNGYVNAAVSLRTTDDNTNRGNGIYSYNDARGIEWFFGNPYNTSDSFSINRRTSATGYNESTADPSYSIFTVSSNGNLNVSGGGTFGGATTVNGKFYVNHGATAGAIETTSTTRYSAITLSDETGSGVFQYDGVVDRFNLTKELNITGDLDVTGTISATDGTDSVEMYYAGIMYKRNTSYLRPDGNATRSLYIGGPSQSSADWRDVYVYTNSSNDFKWNDEIVATQDWVTSQIQNVDTLQEVTTNGNTTNVGIHYHNGALTRWYSDSGTTQSAYLNPTSTGSDFYLLGDKPIRLDSRVGELRFLGNTVNWQVYASGSNFYIRDISNLVDVLNLSNTLVRLNKNTNITGNLEVSGGVSVGDGGTTAKLEVGASTGEVFRADANFGAYRIVANQTDVLLQGATIDVNGNLDVSGQIDALGIDVDSGGVRFKRTGYNQFHFRQSAGSGLQVYDETNTNTTAYFNNNAFAVNTTNTNGYNFRVNGSSQITGNLDVSGVVNLNNTTTVNGGNLNLRNTNGGTNALWVSRFNGNNEALSIWIDDGHATFNSFQDEVGTNGGFTFNMNTGLATSKAQYRIYDNTGLLTKFQRDETIFYHGTRNLKIDSSSGASFTDITVDGNLRLHSGSSANTYIGSNNTDAIHIDTSQDVNVLNNLDVTGSGTFGDDITIPNNTSVIASNSTGSETSQVIGTTGSNGIVIGQSARWNSTNIYSGGVGYTLEMDSSKNSTFNGNLDVSGTGTFGGRVTANDGIVVDETTASSWSSIVQHSLNANSHSVYSAYSNDAGLRYGVYIQGSGTTNSDYHFLVNDQFSIVGSGKVGIGTTSPSSTLTVDGAIEILSDDLTGDDEGGHLILRASSNGTKRWNIDNYADSDLRFFTEDDATGSSGDVKMIILDSGYVGIGTTNPSQKLEVNGAVLSGDYRGSNNIYLTSPDSWIFRSTGGSERMRVTSSGNVGIGTTSPAGKLHIAPNGYSNYVFTGNSTSGYTTTFHMDNTGLDIGHNSTGRALNLKTGSLDRLTISGNGNVGIGTTNPTEKLQLGEITSGGAGASPDAITLGRTFSDTAGQNLKIRVYDDGVNHAGFGVSSGKLDYSVWSSGADHVFYAGSSELMRIKGSGNVGIGTASPGDKLQVAGNAIIQDYAYIGDGVQHWGDGGTGMNFPANDTIDLATSSTSRIRINSSGNVGIGTTTFPTTDIGERELLVQGAIVSKPPGVDDYYSYLKSSWAADGAFELGIQGADVNHKLITTSNYYYGTHLNLWTSDQKRLVIDSIGNVGIGTTSPTEKLTVAGNLLLNSSGEGWIKGYDNYHSIKFRAGGANKTEYYEYGGTLAGGLGHKFFTGGTNQTLRLQIANDGSYFTGNVGIGESNPSHKLDVYTNTDNGYVARFSQDNATGWGVLIDTDGTSNNDPALWVKNATNSVLWAAQSGNVGIGTTSPSYPLEISGTSTVSLAYQRTGVSAKKWGFHSDNSNTYWQNLTDNILALTLSNAGNVGIGTTNPGSRLTVSGTNNATSEITLINTNPSTDNDWSITPFYNDQTLRFRTNSATTTVMTLKDNGNVGIGTTSPGVKLDVDGTARIRDYNDLILNGVSLKGYPNKNLWLIGNENTNVEYTIGTSWNWDLGVSFKYTPYTIGNQTGFLQIGQLQKNSNDWTHGVTSFYVAGSEKMRINNTGNVGIGTTNPIGKLNIEKSAEASIPALGANTGFLKISNTGGNYGSMIGQLGSGNAYFQVQRFDGSATAYNLLLQPNGGNVGIGTDSPSEKLDVVGNIELSGNVIDASSAAYYLDLDGTSRLNHGYFFSTLSFGSFSAGTRGTQLEGYSTHSLVRTDSARLDFYMGKTTTGVGTMMSLTDTGNVGIGTTSPTGKFEVVTVDSNRYIRFKAPNGEERFQFYTGGTGNNAGLYMYSSDGITRNVQISTGGTSYFNGGNVYFNGGNVGIGTTSAAAKLDVNGNIKVSGTGTFTKGAFSPATAASVASNVFTLDAEKQVSELFLHNGNFSISNTISNISNTAGLIITIIILQDSTGSRTITSWGTSVEFGDAGAPTLSTGANKMDMLSFYSDGYKLFFMGIQKGFSNYTLVTPV